MYSTPIEKGDDVMTVEEFRQSCDSGMFIDYDGYGYPVRNNMADPKCQVYPSNLSCIPSDATHIVWFNR